MATLFEFEHDRLTGFEEASLYLFYLGTAKPKAMLNVRDSTADAFDIRTLQLMQRLGPQALAASFNALSSDEGFRANIVVSRQRTEGATLQAFVNEQRRELFARTEHYHQIAEGSLSVAGEPALFAEFRVSLSDPHLVLVQWQVVAVIGDYAYSFFATSAADAWDLHKPVAEAFIAGCRLP